MAEKDVTEKSVEDNADVFADIGNVLIFDGEERIKPADLLTALPRSIYKADGKIHEQERDACPLLWAQTLELRKKPEREH